MYTFYYNYFIIFNDVYLEILKLKIYFKNCAKSKRDEQKRTEGVVSNNPTHFIHTC